MDDRLLKAIVPVAVVAGAVIVYEIISNGRRELRVRSLTASEMRDLIISKYRTFGASYALGLRWVADPSFEEGEEEVRRMLVEYYKGVLSGKVEDVEGEAKEKADAEMRSATNSEERLEVLNKAASVVRYPPSLLFIGPPGVGKSESTYEAAKEIAKIYGFDFIDYSGVEDLERVIREPWRYFVYVDLRLTSLEPSDITGIPRKTAVAGETISEYVPFGWAKALSLSPGLLNLEEITNVSRKDLISAAYQLVLDHRAGFTKFNKGVMVVGLGNPPKWSAVAVELPLPLLNRFETFNVIPPSPREWIAYMNSKFGDEWFRGIGSLLTTAPELMLPSDELLKRRKGLTQKEQIPTPRSWTRLAVQLYRMFSDREDPNRAIRDVIEAVMTKFGGSCEAAVRKTPDDPDYDRDCKLVCELFHANVGVDTTATAIAIISKVYVKPEEIFEKGYDWFVKWFNDTVRVLEEYKIEDPVRKVCSAVRNAISDYLNELYEEEGRGGVEEIVDTLAKIADFIGEKCGRSDVSQMLSPVCSRKDLEIKKKLYEKSRVIKEHVDEYTKMLMEK